MFCYKCGAEIPQGASYCGKCGTKVNSVPEKSTNEVNVKNYVESKLSREMAICIGYAVIVILSLIFTQKDMFNFHAYVVNKCTLGEFIKYADIISSFMDNQMGVGILKFAMFLLIAGELIYIIAAVIAFSNQKKANETNLIFTMSILGMVCNIVAIIICMLCLGFAFKYFTINILLYILINIGIVIYASKFYNNDSLQSEYAGKDYSFSKFEYNSTFYGTKSWKCPECGKVNNTSVSICSCGAKRS